MILLDTSAVIELLEGTVKGQKVQNLIKDNAVGISSITLNEFLIGCRDKQREIFQNFVAALEVFSFDSDAAYKSEFVEKSLMRKGKIIGKMDIFIASICLVQDIPLITIDKDFKNVDRLKVFLID